MGCTCDAVGVGMGAYDQRIQLPHKGDGRSLAAPLQLSFDSGQRYAILEGDSQLFELGGYHVRGLYLPKPRLRMFQDGF